MRKPRSRPLHLFVLVFFTGFFLGLGSSFARAQEDLSFKYLDYFHYVYQTIKQEYVEKVVPENLFYGAIRGMLRSLDDPYSRFLDQKDYAEFHEQVTGEFVGVGIEITIKNGEVVVITPIEGSPAKRSGILSGDRIIKVDDTVLQESEIEVVLKQIKGKPGTKVRLTVKREGYDDPIELTLERANVKVSSVRYGMMSELRDTGYIQIISFYDTTGKDVRNALNDLSKNNINRLVLDLRNNPGGSLDAAIEVAGLFLDKNLVVVSTRGREGSGILEEYKTQGDPIYKGKIIVLANGGSASASEILAGALKDNKRATIAGERTFGKALVQRVIDLEKNKTGFALTIRKYYTPSGAMINKKGIEPEIAIAGDLVPETDRKNLGRILNDKLVSAFVTPTTQYSPATVDAFVQFLTAKGFPVSKRTASYFLKQEISREKPQPVYDLEFDSQLIKALELLK